MSETVLGFDVSKWQDNNSTAQQMDFVKAYNAGIRFAMIKSSQALYQDEDILYNWKTCKTAGILRSNYHFLDWTADPVQQARFCWSLVEKDPPELPPMIDYEFWGTVPANSEDKLWSWLQEMELLCKVPPMIYTGAFFWESQANQDPKWKKYPLVIASYTTREYMETNVTNRTPWDTWTIWQYTSKGNGLLYGAESANIDLDYFNGSYAELLAFAGVTQPEPTQPACEELKNTVYYELVDLQTAINTKAAELMAKVNELNSHMNAESNYIKNLLKPGG